MKEFKQEIFDIEVDGVNYTIEFNRDSLKLADSMGVINGEMGILDKAKYILYAGLKKHKPEITPNLAKKIFDKMIGDDDNEGEYSLTEIMDTIGDEFFRCYNHFFIEGGSKSKKIVSRTNQPKQANK